MYRERKSSYIDKNHFVMFLGGNKSTLKQNETTAVGNSDTVSKVFQRQTTLTGFSINFQVPLFLSCGQRTLRELLNQRCFAVITCICLSG